jgi:hypothetical protein
MVAGSADRSQLAPGRFQRYLSERAAVTPDRRCASAARAASCWRSSGSSNTPLSLAQCEAGVRGRRAHGRFAAPPGHQPAGGPWLTSAASPTRTGKRQLLLQLGPDEEQQPHLGTIRRPGCPSVGSAGGFRGRTARAGRPRGTKRRCTTQPKRTDVRDSSRLSRDCRLVARGGDPTTPARHDTAVDCDGSPGSALAGNDVDTRG